MINLTERQRLALLAGLELLAKQMRHGRAGKAGRRLWSAKQLDELAIRLRSPEAVRLRSPEKEAAAAHTHLANSKRKRTYDVLGECGIHGMICIACEVNWHIEDGPLGWCRDVSAFWRTLRLSHRHGKSRLGISHENPGAKGRPILGMLGFALMIGLGIGYYIILRFVLKDSTG